MSDVTTPPPCVPFPPRDHPHMLLYAVDMTLVPVVFGLGLMGGLLSLIVLQRANLRKESAVYVYLTGITILDLMTLLCVVPKTLQNTEIIQPEITFSKLMAHLTTLSYGISNICKHSTTWLMCVLPLITYACSRNAFSTSRWIKISTSRLIVFLIVLFCIILDFPRFLEVTVTEVKGHCFKDMEIYFWEYTEFGKTNLFIFPLIIVIICFILPVFIMIICSVILYRYIRPKQKQNIILFKAKGPDEIAYQTAVLVCILVVLFCVLQTPDAIVQVFVALFGPSFRKQPGFYEFASTAHLLVLIRSSINFIIYILISSEFRKAFSRTFCCLCSRDEYYEPITCKNCLCCGPDIDTDWRENEKSDKGKKRLFGKSKKNKTTSSWL